jgi:YfiH family protein
MTGRKRVLDNGFVLTDYGKIMIYEISSFKNTGLVRHGFSTRPGGAGKVPYDTLNLAFHVGDNHETVIDNRKVLCAALGTTIENIIAAEQVHGSKVQAVDLTHRGSGALSYNSALSETDGLITNVPGLLLATFYADCVPIFVLDPKRKIIGLAHAGWKGTIARIGACAVAKMAEVYGTDPEDCLAGIGPSIGPCCYEVDRPLINAVKEAFPWWQEVLGSSEGDRAKLDLWEVNRKIMIEAGIREKNVEIAKLCTCCNRDILFSYRGSKGITGRMGAFIMLNDSITEGDTI